MDYAQKMTMVEATVGKVDNPLTEEQLDFILHPYHQGSYLRACPGSGKTEVVGIKTVYEILRWQHEFSGMATLSFTKNAAREISDRVQRYGTRHALTHPHFVGTIDSWLHSFILHPFAHHSIRYGGVNNNKSIRLVDNESHYDFLTSFKTVISKAPNYLEAEVNDYYFECGENIEIQSQRRTLKLDNLSIDVLEELKKNKRKFLDAGLATYADAEFLCYFLMKKNPHILKNIVGRFPIIMVDECQDLSNNQLEIFKLLISAGCIIHLIGDPQQSIYEFKKVYIEKIEEFVCTQGLVRLELTKNFRSTQKIVDLCSNLGAKEDLTARKKIIGYQSAYFSDSCIIWEYSDDNVRLLPQKFIDYIGTLKYPEGFISKPIEINRCAILARGHTTLSQFRSQKINDLTKVQLFANAVECWNQADRKGVDLQNALQQIGKSICMLFYLGSGNHTKQYSPSNYSAIDWRRQLTKTLDFASKPAVGLYPFYQMTWSEWSKNLKHFLSMAYTDFFEPAKSWEQIKGSILAPKKMATMEVCETLKSIDLQYTPNIRLTTFHDIKGETLDAALVISAKDKKSKGGHFEHWIDSDPKNGEYVRFAYVASSRPKHLLIWAIPRTKKINAHLKTLVDLGFTMQSDKTE